MGRSLSTWVLIDERSPGRCIAYPVASPEDIVLGRRDEVLEQLRRALSVGLADADAAQLSRMHQGDGASLHRLDVSFPNPDGTGFSLPCWVVVVAEGSQRWAHVPALGEILWVPRGAQDADDLGQLQGQLERLLHARTQSLLRREDHAGLSGLRRRFAASGRLCLERLHIDLETETAAKNSNDELLRQVEEIAVPAAPVAPLCLVHRERELSLLETYLQRAPAGERTAVLLVAEPGVGKSALLQGWSHGSGTVLYSTSAAQFMAGQSGLGQWQARLQRCLDAAVELDAVLHLPQLVELLGDATEGSALADALLPYLRQRRLRMVAEVSPADLDRLGSRFPGFLGEFLPLNLRPLDRRAGEEAVAEACRHGRQRTPAPPELNEAAQHAIVALCERFLPYTPFPSKAIGMLQRLWATHDLAESIGAHQVHRLFATESGMPLFLLRDETPVPREAIETQLAGRVIGQPNAVAKVADALCVTKAALQPGDRPLGTFLFVGPTGVGKTELARALAKLLFGSEKRMLRFDMSEFSGPGAAQRLVGDGGSPGLLTDGVRTHPFSLLLFDEIEKAHPSVFDLLLQLTGEARLTDTEGRESFFHNTIVILTSNLGSRGSVRSVGFGSESNASARYDEALRQHFRPEFLGRIDAIVPFDAPASQDILHLTKLRVNNLQSRTGLQRRKIKLEVSPSAIQQLAKDGHHPRYGGRALRRHVDTTLGPLIADAIYILEQDGLDPSGSVFRIALSSEGGSTNNESVQRAPYTLELKRLPTPPKGVAESLPRAIGQLRRSAARHLRLDTPQTLRDRRDYLRAALARLEDPRDQKRTTLQEFHRLDAPLQKLDERFDEIIDLEDLIVGATGEEPHMLRQYVHEFSAQWNAGMLQLYLDRDPHHSAAILLLPQDGGSHHLDWLDALGRESVARDWEIAAHLHQDPRPSERPSLGSWGPGGPLGPLVEYLRTQGSRPVILQVRGPYAGAMLALEMGLHRVVSEPSPEHFRLHLLRSSREKRFPLLADDWQHKSLVRLPSPRSAKALRLEHAARVWHADREQGPAPGSRRDALALEAFVDRDEGKTQPAVGLLEGQQDA